jgi:hypothetical protein
VWGGRLFYACLLQKTVFINPIEISHQNTRISAVFSWWFCVFKNQLLMKHGCGGVRGSGDVN